MYADPEHDGDASCDAQDAELALFVAAHCPRCESRLDDRLRQDANGLTMQLAVCTNASCDFYEIVDFDDGRPFEEQEFNVQVGPDQALEGYVYITPVDLVGAKVVLTQSEGRDPKYLKVTAYQNGKYVVTGDDRSLDAFKLLTGLKNGRAYVARPWKEGLELTPF